MQWTVLNAFGAASWLAGIVYAKGTTLPIASNLVGGDNNLVVGAAVSLTGLLVLLWANFRSPA